MTTEQKCIVQPENSFNQGESYECCLYQEEIDRMKEAEQFRQENAIEINTPWNKLKIFTGCQYALWSNVQVTEETKVCQDYSRESKNEYSSACGVDN